MEVHGAQGIVGEHPVERLLREAMIADIWEGTPHRQILDGLEVLGRKETGRALFAHLGDRGEPARRRDLEGRLAEVLALPQERREWEAEAVFTDLARFAAEALAADAAPG
jgi:hypothetical protein